MDWGDGCASARQPRTWLIAQLCGVITAGACFGCWNVQFAADSYSYIMTSQMSLPNAMRSSRTLGYPLLLKAAGTLAPDYRAIPWIHLALLCGTVLFFEASLRRYGGSRWEAFFAACGLLYAMLPWRNQIAYALTDFPSMLMAVSAIGCLFRLVANRRGLIPWLGLAFTVSAAYQIRPAYLFLVVLVPCLGLVLSWLRDRSSIRSVRGWGFAAALAAACIAPLAAYCTARYVVIGRFSLVNYGGYTLSGLASELVDPRSTTNCLPVIDRWRKPSESNAPDLA